MFRHRDHRFHDHDRTHFVDRDLGRSPGGSSNSRSANRDLDYIRRFFVCVFPGDDFLEEMKKLFI